MSEKDIQRKIGRQMQEQFRSNPRKAFEQFGLTASLHRGVVRCVVAFGVLLAVFLIWATIRN